MGTYKEIQNYILEKYSQSVKTCWIAHVKEKVGLNPKKAPNRIDENRRVFPCPKDKEALIIDALKFYHMI